MVVILIVILKTLILIRVELEVSCTCRRGLIDDETHHLPCPLCFPSRKLVTTKGLLFSEPLSVESLEIVESASSDTFSQSNIDKFLGTIPNVEITQIERDTNKDTKLQVLSIDIVN